MQKQVNKVLEKLALTTNEETQGICAAIWHHDCKAKVDRLMDQMNFV